MTLEKAHSITQVWGKYLEFAHGKLSMLFLTEIPESFLPFPPKILGEALNTIAKHYHDTGNKEALRVIEGTIALLNWYTNDERAILQAAKNFNDPNWRASMLPAIKRSSMDWTKSQGNF